MSINITVHGSPVQIRRERILLTDVELLKKNEFNRRRKIRINQVRQQSKDIANQVRQRVRDEKDKHLNLLKEQKTAEHRENQRRKLLSLQKRYQDCLEEVGISHIEAALQPNPDLVLAVEHDRWRAEANTRGREAAEHLRVAMAEQNEKCQLQQNQRNFTRQIENLRSSMVASIPCKKLVKSCTKKKQKKTHPKDVPTTVTRCASPGHKLPVSAPARIMVDTASSTFSSNFIPSRNEISFLRKENSKRDSDKHLDVTSHTHTVEFISNISSATSSTSQARGKMSDDPQCILQHSSIQSKAKELRSQICQKKRDGHEDRAASEKGQNIKDQTAVVISDPGSIENRVDSDSNKRIRTHTAHEEFTSRSQCVEEVAESYSAISQLPRIPVDFRGQTQTTDVHPYSGRVSPNTESTDIQPLILSTPCGPSSPCLIQQDQHRVHFYDHNTRFERQYCPVDLVEKVDFIQPDACKAAEIETAASGAASRPEGAPCARKYNRGQQALAKEKVHRDYHQLIETLSGLAREERLKRASWTPRRPMGMFLNDRRRKERDSRRQKNMDSAFEGVYHNSIPPDNSEHSGISPQDKPCRSASETSTFLTRRWHFSSVDRETPVKLNVGHWGSSAPPTVPSSPVSKGTSSHSPVTSGSFVIGQVPQSLGQTVQFNHEIESQQHSLKSLLERIRIQRSLLLEEAGLSFAPVQTLGTTNQLSENNFQTCISSNIPGPSREPHSRGMEVKQEEEEEEEEEERDPETRLKTRLNESKMRAEQRVGEAVADIEEFDKEKCRRVNIDLGKEHTTEKLKFSEKDAVDKAYNDKHDKKAFECQNQQDKVDSCPIGSDNHLINSMAVMSEYSVNMSLSHTVEQSCTSVDDSPCNSSNTTMVEGLQIKVSVTEKAKMASKEEDHESPLHSSNNMHRPCKKKTHKKRYVKHKISTSCKENNLKKDKRNLKIANTNKFEKRSGMPLSFENKTIIQHHLNNKMTDINKSNMGKKNEKVGCMKCSEKKGISVMHRRKSSRMNYSKDIDTDPLHRNKMTVYSQDINVEKIAGNGTVCKEGNIAGKRDEMPTAKEKLETSASSPQQKWGEELQRDQGSPMDNSGSTSYISPPNYLHAGPSLELEYFMNALNKRREQGIPVDPGLAYYISQLLYMSRASVSELDVSCSDVSTPATEIVEITPNMHPILEKKQVDRILPTSVLKNKSNNIPSNRVEEQLANVHIDSYKRTRTVATNVSLYSHDGEDRMSQSEKHCCTENGNINTSQLTEYLHPPDNFCERHVGIVVHDTVKQDKMPHLKHYTHQHNIPKVCDENELASHKRPDISKCHDDIQVEDTRHLKQHDLPKSLKEVRLIDVGQQTQDVLSNSSDIDIAYISKAFEKLSHEYSETGNKVESQYQQVNSTSTQAKTLGIADRQHLDVRIHKETIEKDLDVRIHEETIEKDMLPLTSLSRNQKITSDQYEVYKSPDVFKEYTNVTDQCSQRISDLSHMIDNIRREKQRLLEMEAGYRCSSTSSSSSDSQVTSVIPPHSLPIHETEPHSSSFLNGGFTNVDVPSTSWSSSGRNIAPSIFHHELSTIIEVDTPQTSYHQSRQQESASQNVSIKSAFLTQDSGMQRPSNYTDSAPSFRHVCNTISPRSVSDGSPRKVGQKTGSPDEHQDYVNPSSISLLGEHREDNQVRKTSSPTDKRETQTHTPVPRASPDDDFLPDIMSEMLHRNLLTSPFSWMKRLPVDSANGHHWDSLLGDENSSCASDPLFESTEDISINCNQQTVQSLPAAPPSSRKKEESGSLPRNVPVVSIESTDESININTVHFQPGVDSSPEDLETAFQRLGIGWASAMLRKTQEAMAISSSSSDNSSRPQLFSSSRSRTASRLIDSTENSQHINSPIDIRGHSTPLVLSDVKSSLCLKSYGPGDKHNVLSFSGESRISTVSPVSPNEDNFNLQIRSPNMTLISKSHITDVMECHSSKDGF